MWKRKLVWKNDSIEFTFQDQVVTLEESLQDDKMEFKAIMKNGDQIKEVEIKLTLKTVPEQKQKAEKQEYFEQDSLLNTIKLEEDNNNVLRDSQRIDLGKNAKMIEKVTEKTQDDVSDVKDVKNSDSRGKRKRSALDAFKDETSDNVNDVVGLYSSKKKHKPRDKSSEDFGTIDKSFNKNETEVHKTRPPRNVSLRPEHRKDSRYTFENPSSSQAYLPTLTCTFPQCSEVFESGEKLKKHFGKVHEVKKEKLKRSSTSHLRCCLCRKTFSSKNMLFEHQKIEHKYKCDQCSRSYILNPDLLHHILKYHDKIKSDSFTCPNTKDLTHY